jgi:predicted RNase H-like HicB family nuclease
MSGQTRQRSAIVYRDGEMFVALCPELDIASQGTNVEEARANLIEAVELFMETASHSERQERLSGGTYATHP